MSVLHGIVYFFAPLSPLLALEILREESANIPVCTSLNFIENWSIQQLFGLLITLLRGGGMRDGRAVERDRNDCRRAYPRKSDYEIEDSVPDFDVRCLLNN